MGLCMFMSPESWVQVLFSACLGSLGFRVDGKHQKVLITYHTRSCWLLFGAPTIRVWGVF